MEPPEIEYIYNLRRFGMKMDLSVMRELARELGEPQNYFKSVHVTGTNGKGSVCAFVYSILKRKYSTALYTSPHISRYTERIVVDDEEIPLDYVINFIREWKEKIEKLAKENRNPTFFEVTTALAFKYFRDMNVDFAVVEVGLGGRLDATNIIIPEVAGIVTVDLEHTKTLGNTIEDIAREKAGIIKPNVPVVVGERKINANRIIREIAERKHAPYHNIHEEFKFEDVKISIEGLNFKTLSPVREYKIQIPLTGMHQLTNAAVALRIAELLEENYSITKRDIEEGLKNAKWKGRFEIKRRDPLLIFDSAHNPSAMERLVETIKVLKIKNPLFLFSMLSDKDMDSVLKKIGEVSDRIIVTEISYEKRRASLEDIARVAHKYFSEVRKIRDPCEALNYCIERGENTIATGSIYLLGDLEKCMG